VDSRAGNKVCVLPFQTRPYQASAGSREDSNKWLLIKAGESLTPFSENDDGTSVVSGRSMSEIAETNDEPMRCKPVTALPDDGRWRFEIKFDGYR
jgi:hypothetical protein